MHTRITKNNARRYVIVDSWTYLGMPAMDCMGLRVGSDPGLKFLG